MIEGQYAQRQLTLFHHSSASTMRFAPFPYLRWLVPAVVLSAGCAGDDAQPTAAMPPLETRADSLSMRAYEAMGTPEAWASLPYLRFDFGAERDGTRQVSRRHLWDRRSGDYRLEWTGGRDSVYTALFNVNTRDGQVYLNGTPLDAAANEEQLQSAYRGFINDTYWLMAPVKMLDPGVQRSYVADSSDAEHDVVHLAFDNVGLTPGDQYWMYVNRETGRVDRWAFRLQSGNEGNFEWVDYEAHPTPGGTLHIATRKQAIGQPFALLTDHLEMPTEVPEEMFTDPEPRLMGSSAE